MNDDPATQTSEEQKICHCGGGMCGCSPIDSDGKQDHPTNCTCDGCRKASVASTDK